MAKGRPRGFDPDEVLEAALDVFWRKGYEGATMADLTAATGLRPGSIYAAYESKLGLFRQVARHYVATVFGYAERALLQDTPRAVITAWLRGAADATTDTERPPGCLMVQGALAGGEPAAQEELCSWRTAGERLLTNRLAELGVPDAGVAAAYVATLSEGFAVQAASGATRERLHQIVDLSLRSLPW
jgi:AcrR family transcriptional regulator